MINKSNNLKTKKKQAINIYRVEKSKSVFKLNLFDPLDLPLVPN
jgi:hypothetical protein